MNKVWPAFLLTVLFFVFLSYPKTEPQLFTELSEGCLVLSMHYRLAIEANNILEPYLWTRVLAIHFYGKVGHAVTVFIHKNVTYVYDPNRGSFVVSAYPLYDPLAIAEICFPKLVIRKAYYIEPTMLLPLYKTEVK
jgi:hypothetical protein